MEREKPRRTKSFIKQDQKEYNLEMYSVNAGA
jgi:hypothetical protein